LSDLEQEVNQTGFLNTAGQIATEYWNTSTGALFSEVNELFGGTPDYFKKKEYKPLQAEKKEAYQDLTQNSDKEPTPEEVTEKAKEIFLKKKKEDYIQSKQNKLLQNTSEEDLEKLQLNLIKSHAIGIGEPEEKMYEQVEKKIKNYIRK
jgi:hypothetical protein